MALLLVWGLSPFLLARLIQTDRVAGSVKAALSRNLGGTVDFRRIELVWLPRPVVRIRDGKLSLPGATAFSFAALTVRPDWLRLLRGDVSVRGWTFEKPFLAVAPGLPQGKSPAPPAVFPEIASRLQGLLGLVIGDDPNVRLRVNGGRLLWKSAEKGDHLFTGVDAAVEGTRRQLSVKLRCASSLWRRLSLEGRLDPDAMTGRGLFTLEGLKPEPLFGPLAAATGIAVEMPPVDLKARFDISGQDRFQVDAKGRLPAVTLRRGGDPVRLGPMAFEGAFRLDRRGSVLTLAHGVSGGSGTRVSATLETGPPGAFHTAPASLVLDGHHLAIAPFRRAALTLLDDRPFVRNLFDVIRAGRAPRIALDIRGDSPPGLLRPDAVVLDGRIAEGEIHVPDAGLDLDAVFGDVAFSAGVLQGFGLSARLGNTDGRNGGLILDFTGEDLRVELGIDVDADLSQLPPLLRRWSPNDRLRAELAELGTVRGRAKGRLSLGIDGNGVQTGVAATSFDLTADYLRLPCPVALKGTDVTYAPGRLTATILEGRLGRSLFSDVVGAIGWTDTPRLEILSATADVAAGEADPWLRTLPPFETYRKRVAGMEGSLRISTLALEGPLFRPVDWRYTVAGELENVDIVFSGESPGPVHVETGRFRLEDTGEGRTLDLASLDTAVGGTGLNLSGRVRDPLRDGRQARFRLSGEIDAGVMDWLCRRLGLPPELALKTPLEITGGRLAVGAGDRLGFAGRLSGENGLDLTLETDLRPDRWRLDVFQLKDDTSLALLHLARTAENFQAAFSGRLTCGTLNRLLPAFPGGGGSIAGDFWFETDGKPLPDLYAVGRLSVENVAGPPCLPFPLDIEKGSVEARGTRFSFDDTRFDWEGRRVTLKGAVDYTEKTLHLDLAADVDHVEWHRLEERIAEAAGGGGSPGRPNLGGVPLRGNMGITAGTFTFAPFTWKSVQADVIFNPTGVNVAVARADLCGVDTPGVVAYDGASLRMDFEPTARGREVAPTVDCLLKGEVLSSGTFDLSGRIRAKAPPGRWLQEMGGDLEYRARDGRILRHVPLAKLFAFLDVTGIVQQLVPAVEQEGFPYRSMVVKGRIENASLVVTEGVIDSPVMEIALQGRVDLEDRRLDLDVLAAPLQPVNYLIKKVPVVNEIMGGTLISIPIKIQGDWSDPEVTPLDLEMVGAGLVGIMKRTLQLPIKLLEPMIPRKNADPPPASR